VQNPILASGEENEMKTAKADRGRGLIGWLACLPLTIGLLSVQAGLFAAHAQEPKLVRIIANRSVSGVALWGIGPFAKDHGVRTEMDAAATNAEMQRAIQAGDVQVTSTR